MIHGILLLLYRHLVNAPLETRLASLVWAGGAAVVVSGVVSVIALRGLGLGLSHTVVGFHAAASQWASRQTAPSRRTIQITNSLQHMAENWITWILRFSGNRPDYFVRPREGAARPFPWKRWGAFVVATGLITTVLSLSLASRIGSLRREAASGSTEEKERAVATLQTYCEQEARLLTGDTHLLARLGRVDDSGGWVVVVPDFQSFRWRIRREGGFDETVAQTRISPMWPAELRKAEQPPGEPIDGTEVERFLASWTTHVEEGNVKDDYSAPPHLWRPDLFDVRYEAMGPRPQSLRILDDPGEQAREGPNLRKNLALRGSPFSITDLKSVDPEADSGAAEWDTRETTLDSGVERVGNEDGTTSVSFDFRDRIGLFRFHGRCTLLLVKVAGRIRIVSERGAYAGRSEAESVQADFDASRGPFIQALEALLSSDAEQSDPLGDRFTVLRKTNDVVSREMLMGWYSADGLSADERHVTVRLPQAPATRKAPQGGGFVFETRQAIEISRTEAAVDGSPKVRTCKIRGRFRWNLSATGTLTLVSIDDAEVDPPSERPTPPQAEGQPEGTLHGE